MKIIKIYQLILLVLIVLFVTSCTAKKDLDNTITITDNLEERVVVKKNPNKVACVSRTTYDLLIAFGLGDKVDGAFEVIYNNPWTHFLYPKSKFEHKYKYKEQAETFIKRGIDLVFSPEKKITDDLKKHGIIAVNISLYGKPTFDEYLFKFSELVAKIWDTPEVIEKVTRWQNDVKNAFYEVNSKIKNNNVPVQKLMYVRGDKNKGIGYTDQKGSFAEYAFRKLGFDFAGNYFDTNKPSAEAIIRYNPDVFVIGGMYQKKLALLLQTDPIYNKLHSVKSGKVFTIPVGFTIFEQLSIMTPIFIYDMANKLHPSLFKYNIHEMIADTISRYFNIKLTNEQINYMLEGLDPQGNLLAK